MNQSGTDLLRGSIPRSTERNATIPQSVQQDCGILLIRSQGGLLITPTHSRFPSCDRLNLNSNIGGLNPSWLNMSASAKVALVGMCRYRKSEGRGFLTPVITPILSSFPLPSTIQMIQKISGQGLCQPVPGHLHFITGGS